MYAKAHEIIGLLYSYADKGRYKSKESAENESEAVDVVNE